MIMTSGFKINYQAKENSEKERIKLLKKNPKQPELES